MDGVSKVVSEVVNGENGGSTRYGHQARDKHWEEKDVPRENEDGSGERLSFVVIMGVYTGNYTGRLVEGIEFCTTPLDTAHPPFQVLCGWDWRIDIVPRQCLE